MLDTPDKTQELVELIYRDLKVVIGKHVKSLDPVTSSDFEIKDSMAALMTATITLAGEVAATACRAADKKPEETRAFTMEKFGDAFDHFVIKLPTLDEFIASKDVAGHD